MEYLGFPNVPYSGHSQQEQNVYCEGRAYVHIPFSSNTLLYFRVHIHCSAQFGFAQGAVSAQA